MSASSEQVSAAVSKMSSIASESSDNTRYIADTSVEQLAAIKEIAISADSLNQRSQELKKIIENFKV